VFIYKVTNKINGKVYVGKWQGKNVATRWERHLKTAASGKGYYFHNAIRKYGEAGFTMETIASATTKEGLIQLEKQFISELDATNPSKGYNLTKGGEGGFTYPGARNPFYGKHHTPKTKDKLRACGWIHIGKKRSISTKDRISRALKGKTRSEEHALHISESKKGIPLSEERREACSAHLRSLKRTPEWKSSISSALKGKPKSDEHRRKLSEARKSPLVNRVCPTCNTTFLIPNKLHSKKCCSRSCSSFLAKSTIKNRGLSY